MTGVLIATLLVSTAVAAAAAYDASRIRPELWERSNQPRGMWVYGPLAAVPVCGMGGALGVAWFAAVRNRVLRARTAPERASLEKILDEFRTRAADPPEPLRPDQPQPQRQPQAQAQPEAPAAPPPPLAPAAWVRDPTGRHQLRYWNGSAWTQHVADAGVTSTDPI